jgi:hypothetical protein
MTTNRVRSDKLEGASRIDPDKKESDGPTEDPTENDDPADGIADEVAAGVEFAKLISMSSLGTPAAREARLIGRKEIEKHEESMGHSRALSAHEEQVKLAIADELEIRGYTFEAELHYRRLAPHSRTATVRLAQLLEMKGFRGEAWALYRRAARRNEANSLLRLSVICHQRGQKTRAKRLMQDAYANLEISTLQLMEEQVDRACGARRQVELGGHIASEVNTPNIDATYALGSYFFVIAERADLARVAYCSALGRGHSLAGASLLDMTPRSREHSAIQTSGYLDDLFTGDANVHDCKEQHPPPEVAGTLESHAPLLKNTMQRATFGQLHEALSCPGQETDSADALERVLINARLFTIIRGYSRLGTEQTSDSIKAAGDEVCSYISQRAQSGQITNGRELINDMWSRSCLEISRLEGTRSKGGCAPRFNRRRQEFVRGAGTATRMGEAFTRLPEIQARLITQRVCGLYHDEVADAMGMSVEDTRPLYRSGVRGLREAQQGEQIPTSNQLLWEEVESSFIEGGKSAPNLDSSPRYYPISGPEGEVPIESLDKDQSPER